MPKPANPTAALTKQRAAIVERIAKLDEAKQSAKDEACRKIDETFDNKSIALAKQLEQLDAGIVAMDRAARKAAA